MKKFIRLTATLALFAVAVFAISQNSVTAQSTGLRINPRADLTVKPSETQTGSLLVANLNKDVAITVGLSVVDFKSVDETGTAAPILEENAEPTAWSLKPFITVPTSVELKPGETKYVPYSVRIPQGQGAGSYYSAIKYDPQPTDEQSTVVLTGAPMQLVFVTVPGKATELLSLKDFGAYKIKDGETNGTFASIFVGGQPQRLAYLLKNSGNVAENPKGGVIIKNIFGKEVRSIENANPKNNLALIDQTRRFETCIEGSIEEVEQDGRTIKLERCVDPGLLPGMYTAELSLFYGINGNSTQEINAVSTFWYLPWWFLGLVLGLLAILAFVILIVRKRLLGRSFHRRKRP
jgi:hypothetical protein